MFRRVCFVANEPGFDSKDVECPSQIVDERREAEFGAHIVEASHQEGALVHPLLDAAEGMLDDLATPKSKPQNGRWMTIGGFALTQLPIGKEADQIEESEYIGEEAGPL